MFQLAAKDNEIQRLLDELSNQLQEYQVDTNVSFQPASCCIFSTYIFLQNLMDTKIALDMEIAVFRRLLESEEDRLGILGPDALGTDQALQLMMTFELDREIVMTFFVKIFILQMIPTTMKTPWSKAHLRLRGR